jgi:hypothetical protein
MPVYFVAHMRSAFIQLIVGMALCVGLASPIAAVPAMAASSDQMKLAIKDSYEAYLRRSLTSQELSQLYAENWEEIASGDDDRLKESQEAIAILRNQDGKPAALHARHAIIQYFVFNKKHPFGASLVTSLDAVAVADQKREELMTESDVRAFVNIVRFANSGADPATIDKEPLSNDAQIAATVATELSASINEGGALPEMLLNASGFWAGLVQNWASLSAQEKQAARDYITQNLTGRLTELTDTLYSRLMGWSNFEIKMAHLNKTIAVGQMYSGLYSRIIGLNSMILGNNPWARHP